MHPVSWLSVKSLPSDVPVVKRLKDLPTKSTLINGLVEVRDVLIPNPDEA